MNSVDLRSDTVTQPTEGMKRFMLAAPLGDDVLGDDPTVERLEAMAAERLHKEAAMFVPSGTMANQVAIRLHTQPGDEIWMEANAHPFHYEAGAAAAISGVQIRLFPGTRGQLAVETLSGARPPTTPEHARPTLLCLEDTSNRGGGTVYPLETLDALAHVAREFEMGGHLDGARGFNAAVASGIPFSRRAQAFDTVSFCLSKGLGAPVGSLICGPSALIARARRIRKMLGGGMRQAGILAAAGIYALEHHVERLADDHARARELAEGVRAAGFEVDQPETNIVLVRALHADRIQADLAQHGVRCFSISANALRLVTHLGVTDAGIRHTIRAFGELSSSGSA